MIYLLQRNGYIINFTKSEISVWQIFINQKLHSNYMNCQARKMIFHLQICDLNPFHPNIQIHNLHTVLNTLPKVLTRRISLTIKSFFSSWSLPFQTLMCDWGVTLLGEIKCSSWNSKGKFFCTKLVDLPWYDQLIRPVNTLNPLIPRSDYRVTSPYSIHT